jgi:hypothetical protein
MKKSPVKEFIISSVAAAVAGFIVKKGYDFFLENELPKVPEKKKHPEDKSLLDTSASLVNKGVTSVESLKNESPAQQGLIATLFYTVTVFTITKFLRKIV